MRAAANHPTLSVVIVSWNTRDLLAECLGSLAELRRPGEPPDQPSLDGIPTKIFVVDNASDDGTVSMVRQRFPWVQLLANHENVGFARANNQAIEHSRDRYVLLLNPDTRIHRGSVATLVGFMDACPAAGAAGPRLLNPDGSLQLSCSPTPTLAREFWRLFHLDPIWPRGTYAMDTWDADAVREVDVVGAACLLLRRDALEQAGLLDEDYFMYSEEDDLCHRLAAHGWRRYWVPRATVVHYGGQSTRQRRAAMFQQLYRSRLLFFRKRHGPFQSGLYKLLLVAAAAARVLASHAIRPAETNAADNYRRLLRELPRL